MKKVKLTGRLSLNKETVARLNDNQMNGVRGGSASVHTCATVCPLCPTDGCPASQACGTLDVFCASTACGTTPELTC